MRPVAIGLAEMNDQRYETYAAGRRVSIDGLKAQASPGSSPLRRCRCQYRDRLRAVRAVLEQLGAGLVSTAAPGRSARCIPPLAEPANVAADLAARRPRCAGCRYRADDRHSIEQSIPGLAVFSSGFGASVTTTRRCTLHDRFVSPDDACNPFAQRHAPSRRCSCRPPARTRMVDRHGTTDPALHPAATRWQPATART